MAWFPKIERPCPYLDRLDAVMDGDFCRMCQRQVHDLTGMDDAGRAAFMAACGGDACISYTARLSPALAAAALAASAAIAVAPAPAAAQRHKPRPAHLRPVRHVPHPAMIQAPTMYFTAGLPALPPQPRLEPIPPPPEPPAAAERKPETKPE